MIQFVNVSKSFGHQQVITDANFVIHPGERVGFVGQNGTGKSTLFEMLAGHTTPDKGECSYPSSQRLGYVRQQLNTWQITDTLLEYAENALPELVTMQEEMDAIEHRLQSEDNADEKARLLKRLGVLQTKLEHLGGYDLKYRASAVLSGLGFPVSRFNDKFSSFSGGWQIRASLARIIVSQPDILLLDEPTNYLDVPAVEWLRDYLKSYQGTLLLVSHDRYLLNSLTNVTIEVMGGHVTRYTGNYAQYMRDREMRHAQMIAEKRNVDRKKEQLERFIDRFKGKATKAAQAQSKQKELDKLNDVEVRSIAVRGPHIRLPEPPRSGQEVVKMENVYFSYDGQNNVVHDFSVRLERGDHAAFVGLNGMGKTTLLRLMCGKLTPTGGKVAQGYGVELGYQSQDFAETLDPAMTIYETAKNYASDRTEGEIRDLLSGFGFYGEALEKKVQVLSGGEKVRLALARLLLRPLNFLILDEPTTHLDIYAREALQEALQKYKGTLCLVSHDIEFVRAVAKTIFHLDNDGITRYYGDYDYYREKRAQELALKAAAEELVSGAGQVPKAQPQAEAPPAVKSGSAPVSYAERKQRKREESMIRSEINKLKKPHEAIVADTEAQMADLETEQKTIYEKIAAATAGTDFAGLQKRAAEIDRTLEDLAWKWEAASTEIEKLEKECAQRIEKLNG